MSVHFLNGASPIITQSSSSAPQRTSHIAPSYLGPSAQFILEANTWEKPFYTGSDACRYFLFKSITEGSAIDHFSVYGCWDGTIKIAACFNWENYSEDKIAEFLKSHDLVLIGKDRCVAKTAVELTNLFQIISNNNTIPTENLDTIRNIIKEGKCAPAPQYRPYETPASSYVFAPLIES